MKKIFIILIVLFFSLKVGAENIKIGTVTLVIGEISTSKGRVLKSGDPIYFNEIIITGNQSKSQIILLDQTVMMIGEATEMSIDEFIYSPEKISSQQSNDKITTRIKQGSIKVLSGKISESNPDSLVIKTPAGTIGTRGTEFQALVDEEDGDSKVLLIGPGTNNTLGLRPGEVEVSNSFGTVLLDRPFLFTSFSQNQAPTAPIIITQEDFNNFLTVMEARVEINEDEQIDEEQIKEDVKEGLFKSGKESGNELVAKVIDIALKKTDGGVTAAVLVNALGVSVEQLFGEDYKKEFDNETEGNKIIIANGEFGDAIAMISRYGGTDQGYTSYADLAGKSSGTYTYIANGINGAAAEGVGSGKLDVTVVIDFAAKDIKQTVSGTAALGSDNSRTFGNTTTATDYTSSSSDVAIQQNLIIAANGSTSTDATNFGSSTPQAADSDNKSDFDNGGTNSYFLNHDFRASNIKLGSGVNNDPIAFGGHINIVIENLDGSALENRLSFSRTGITPKKD